MMMWHYGLLNEWMKTNVIDYLVLKFCGCWILNVLDYDWYRVRDQANEWLTDKEYCILYIVYHLTIWKFILKNDLTILAFSVWVLCFWFTFLGFFNAAATPKQIRELMQVDGLTNDEVKSHLQVSPRLVAWFVPRNSSENILADS